MPVALELLAPARNKDIGIAAIDCGADAVYIAGPDFGAREAAGNPFGDIALLTDYAHRFGAKVYLTLNTIIYEEELEKARQCVFGAVEAGCDALIIQDLGILKMSIPPIELHASTQCNIRTPEQARWLSSLGFRKLVLARELSLEQIRGIAEAVPECELECFVHGALCVCYSGQCYLSQYLTGRSANRGSCIQACRSLYDVQDASGKVLLPNKAVLSLKDLSLLDRLEQLAGAGATSFKIEGRLKNISYVRNIVRAYSDALDSIVKNSGGRYTRSSWGTPEGGFTPNPTATFNRGYTSYFIDGKRGKWNSRDYAKGIGEPVGRVSDILSSGNGTTVFRLSLYPELSTPVSNGDGLCFIGRKGKIYGMRANSVKNSCEISCLMPEETSARLVKGREIFRSFNQEMESSLNHNLPSRLIPADLTLSCAEEGGWVLRASTVEGLELQRHFNAEPARERAKAEAGLKASLSRKSGLFTFTLTGLPEDGLLPFLPSSAANALRREMAVELEDMLYDRMDTAREEADMTESIPWEKIDHSRLVRPEQVTQLNCANSLAKEVYAAVGIEAAPAYELDGSGRVELMRCKYCLRYEMGICPKQSGNRVRKASPLYLVNNGRPVMATFDCFRCEMVIKSANP